MAESARLEGRVLIVAGSDSGGGAGIQADIKTVSALGAYAATAVTALTAQNTHGVFGVVAAPVDFVAQQMELVLEDIGADCIKTGMLYSAEIARTVARVIEARAAQVPLVLDPVMVAKGGASLLTNDAGDVIRSHLLPLATVVTPNVPEAEVLSGCPIATEDDMAEAAEVLLRSGAGAVLIKGGHLEGECVTDLLFDREGAERISHARIETPHTHGTGCTLASAIAAGLSQGMPLRESVRRANAYVLEAIRTAPGLGRGHGPLNHMWPCAGGRG
jgi:hydroxymethylpyrimidine/phosphomethylpyrimidine kinase